MGKLLCQSATITIYLVSFYLPTLLAFDYCGTFICNGSRHHTLCKFKINSPASRCNEYERTLLDAAGRRILVDKLNKRRNIISSGQVRSFPSAANMRKLIWNEELSVSAQRWADQCIEHSTPDIQDDCRDLESTQVGQNIATIVGEAPGLAVASLVDVWYMQLMDLNPSIVSNYYRAPSAIQTHEDYFTQLVWAETFQVGCGGVKFKENYYDSGKQKSRIIHRVVCNFAPRGNVVGQPVYEEGAPCSKCKDDSVCDTQFTALCDNKAKTTTIFNEVPTYSGNTDQSAILPLLISTKLHSDWLDVIDHASYPHLFNLSPKSTTNNLPHTFTNLPRLDFLSELLENTKKPSSILINKEKSCKPVLAIDDLLNILKKKLSDDPAFQKMMTTDKKLEDTFADTEVENFISKLYKNKFSSTTQKVTENENLNSSLLVNLVEAVIFRNSGKYTSPASEFSTESTLPVSQVKIKQIQAEFAPITPNNQFDGHYFFPEEETEEAEDGSSENTESYYEANFNISPSDILAEINDIKKKSEARNFLDDILETEDLPESTTASTIRLISPDNLGLVKDGYNNMKRFLDEIGEKRTV